MKWIKPKLFSLFGVLCLGLISYEFYSRFYLWKAIMDGATGRNREKYMALRDVFLKRYGDENLYHVTNLTGITGISIILGSISILFFLLIFISIENSSVKSNTNILKKIMLIALMVSASIITFLNLWSLM
jgi:hypothetical protein